jgi:hypothetical protein
MNTSNVLACITISMLFGLAVGYATGQQDNGKVLIHKTRSGSFIIVNEGNTMGNTMGKGKAEEKIYEVLEMPTNKKSFQDQEVEFK